MKVYLDADGAPWCEEVIECANRHGITVVVVSDYSHVLSQRDGAERVVVDHGRDAADFAIVNRVLAGDLVVTQDGGLASLVLPKGAVVISPRGFEFTEDAMETYLTRRWFHSKLRLAGRRIKGPAPLSGDDRDRFLALFERKIIASTRRLHEDS